MNDLAKLNELAKAEIEQLETQGIRVTPEEVVEINALGWSVHRPETRRLLARGRPVPVGGVVLWPLTLAALDWLDRNHVATDRAAPEIAYAMCHGRTSGDELDCEGREAVAKVKQWYSRLPCTPSELIEAIAQVDAQDSRAELPPDPDGHPMSLGDFSAFLTANCGGDPEFWERRVSIGYCCALLATLVMQNHADKRPCSHDPRIIAERSLGWAVEKIKARHVCEAVPT